MNTLDSSPFILHTYKIRATECTRVRCTSRLMPRKRNTRGIGGHAARSRTYALTRFARGGRRYQEEESRPSIQGISSSSSWQYGRPANYYSITLAWSRALVAIQRDRFSSSSGDVVFWERIVRWRIEKLAHLSIVRSQLFLRVIPLQLSATVNILVLGAVTYAFTINY